MGCHIWPYAPWLVDSRVHWVSRYWEQCEVVVVFANLHEDEEALLLLHTSTEERRGKPASREYEGARGSTSIPSDSKDNQPGVLHRRVFHITSAAYIGVRSYVLRVGCLYRIVE